MADNVVITSGANSTPPANTVIATDEVSSVHYQAVKIALGADGAVDTLLDSGPQTAPNSVPVVPATARNTYGSQASVLSGNTATLVNYAADADWKFIGFIAGGEVDGRFYVEFDGVAKYVVRTNIAQRHAELVLPFPDGAAASTTVTLKVENTGGATGDFEGTLLGV